MKTRVDTLWVLLGRVVESWIRVGEGGGIVAARKKEKNARDYENRTDERRKEEGERGRE